MYERIPLTGTRNLIQGQTRDLLEVVLHLLREAFSSNSCVFLLGVNEGRKLIRAGEKNAKVCRTFASFPRPQNNGNPFSSS